VHGKDALRAIADQWRYGGTRIPEVSERREAFNIMLSMPSGTDARVVQKAAREFAKAELANHRYVMVLHTHHQSSRPSACPARPTVCSAATNSMG
jgi:hypothetical protein